MLTGAAQQRETTEHDRCTGDRPQPDGRRSTTTVNAMTHSDAVLTITVDGPAPIRPVASFQITTSKPTSTPAQAAGAKPGPGRRAPARHASSARNSDP